MATLLSPVLVGRDDLLALTQRRLAAAGSGVGHLLLLAGEAGIGKTRLLGAARRQAEQAGFATATAATFIRDTELAGGLLLDLAVALRAGPAHHEVAERIVALLREDLTDAAGDQHRRRRLAVIEIAEVLASLPRTDAPMLLALEDLHWADDLSLEVIGRLARRLADRPMLVIGTYRSDELHPGLPLRQWRSLLLGQRLAEEARLRRLSLAETTTMIQATLSERASGERAAGERAAGERLVRAVFARSDGIPLHVEEFLDVAIDNAQELPATLADAVIGRADRLAPETRAVAEAASVIGRSFDFDLLVEVAGTAPEAVAAALRDLGERSFTQPGADPATIDFRHALIRDALYDRLDLVRRRTLHARVARAPASLPDAVRSAHCEAAALRPEAYALARRAAAEAARTSAHREAFELLRRAQRCLPPGTEATERADLLAALATEALAIDENALAARCFEQSYELYLRVARPGAAAALVAPWTATRHLLGDDLDARVARLTAGLTLLDGLPGEDETRVALLAGLAAAYMLDRRLDESIVHGEAALALAPADLDTAATLGSVLVFAGRFDEGWPMLESAITRARAQRHEAQAARAYRMLGSCASMLVDYDRAGRWLAEGIDYAERVELANHRHYMVAHLAHVCWATGEADRAEALAEAALADGRGGITTRITALHVLGYVALGRGEATAARSSLEEAHRLAEPMAELQRLAPAWWGLAEAALLEPDASAGVRWCERGLAASAEVADAAYLFPFVVTGTRAYLQGGDPGAAARWLARCGPLLRARSIPGTLPALAHAQGLLDLAAGRVAAARDRLTEALAGWEHHHRSWEAASCRLDLATVGAASTPAWHPLSAREFEVAGLIADGLTNREIAARLHLAPKTVSAHVEHILTKLGAARRAEVAAWVATRRTAPAR